jgi:hypothetical protein
MKVAVVEYSSIQDIEKTFVAVYTDRNKAIESAKQSLIDAMEDTETIIGGELTIEILEDVCHTKVTLKEVKDNGPGKGKPTYEFEWYIITEQEVK